jgi:hypothetical protein
MIVMKNIFRLKGYEKGYKLSLHLSQRSHKHNIILYLIYIIYTSCNKNIVLSTTIVIIFTYWIKSSPIQVEDSADPNARG